MIGVQERRNQVMAASAATNNTGLITVPCDFGLPYSFVIIRNACRLLTGFDLTFKNCVSYI
jgi:hypothetical protein